MSSRLKFPSYLIPVLAFAVVLLVSAVFVKPAHAAYCSPGQYISGSFLYSCNPAHPGWYAPGDDHEYPCPIGTYTPGYGYSSCLPAPAGTYVSSTGTSSPSLCPAGTYNPLTGSTSSSDCLQTPPGSYSGSGYSSPVPCNYGEYQPNAGSASCLWASAGYFVNSLGAQAQTACAIGTFQPNSHQTFCYAASAGYFVPNTGMSYQVACFPGTYQQAIGQGSCVQASPGYYVSSSAATTQTACAVGSYQDLPGKTSCKPASAGNYVAAPASVAQTQCALGTYQPSTGQSSCLIAGIGFYVDSLGAISETACSAGFTTLSTGSTSANDCVSTDQTAPTIAINTPVDGATYVLNAVVNADYSCADEAGGSGLASCVGDVANGAAIDTSSIGAHTFSVNAADNAGNPSSMTVNYSVVYAFTGFSAPVDPNVMNVAKAGQSIPLKWYLADANGNPILDLSSVSVKAESLSCSLGSTTDLIEEYASGSSGLQNLGGGFYQFNWASPKAYASSCKTVKVSLPDNSVQSAMFKFTK